MKKYLTQHRVAAILIFFFVVIVPGFFFGTSYIVRSIEGKSEQIKSMKIDQEINQEFLRSVSELRANKDLIVSKEKNLDVLLSDDDAQKVALFAEIEKLALSTGHSSVHYEPGKAVAPGKTQENKIAPYSDDAIFLQLRMTGTYENFLSFLHKFEHLNYLGDVLDISLVARVQDEIPTRLRNTRASNDEEDKDLRENLVDSDLSIVVYFETLTETAEDSEDEEKEDDEQGGRPQGSGETS